MSITLSRPEGFAWLTPFLVVRDAAKSLDFYEKAFSFERGGVLTDSDGRISHADVLWQGGIIAMFEPESLASGRQAPITSGVKPSVLLYVYVSDVDTLAINARKAGATILSEPADMLWGDRMTSIADLDGYIWNFATHLGFGESAFGETAA